MNNCKGHWPESVFGEDMLGQICPCIRNVPRELSRILDEICDFSFYGCPVYPTCFNCNETLHYYWKQIVEARLETFV